jgi:hypothetical protein
MGCKLQVFKLDSREHNSKRSYRFAVVDYNKSNSYPANFVCMLPLRLYSGKTNKGSVFGELYQEKSLDFAIGLLNDALLTEKDSEVITEIEKRLKLIDPKQINVIKCAQCKKAFQPQKIRRYKQNLCEECLKKKCRSISV